MPYTIERGGYGCDGYAVVKEGGGLVPGGCHETLAEAQAHLAALKHNVEDAMLIEQIGERFYATARAWIVETVDDLPREIASEIDRKKLNESFIWIAGRYVQANNPNRNGHYWTFDDLQAGEASIRYSPLNVSHQWERPVGTFVQTKIVHREEAATGRTLPEIQALSVLWAANFPEVAARVREAHEAKMLHYSMECVSEKIQCMTCEEIFPYRSAAHERCEHLASDRTAVRRFINPIFLGGALVLPPQRPAWPDADVTEVAHLAAQTHADRATDGWKLTKDAWEQMMLMAMETR